MEQSSSRFNFIKAAAKRRQQDDITGVDLTPIDYDENDEEGVDTRRIQIAKATQWFGGVVGDMFALSRGNTPQQVADGQLAREHRHRQHEHLLKHKVLIGAQGKTLARYWIELGPHNRFQSTAAWYLNEAHHDPTGSDPTMIAMFLVAFLARFVYASALEAFVFGLIISPLDALVWFVARAAWPVISQSLDATESIWLTFVYNLFSFATAIAVASYALALWPGLASVSDVLTQPNHNTSYFLWVNGVDTRVFLALLYLFMLALFSGFAALYAVSLFGFVLFAPFSVAILRFDEHEPLRLFNSLLFCTLSMAFFYASFARPIRNTYVWNLVLAVSWYLFVISIIVGFGFT